MSNSNKDYNKNEEARNNPIIGWFFIALVIGVPVVIVFCIVTGIGQTDWGIKLMGKAFWWGLGILTLLAMFGCNPFEGDKK